MTLNCTHPLHQANSNTKQTPTPTVNSQHTNPPIAMGLGPAWGLWLTNQSPRVLTTRSLPVLAPASDHCLTTHSGTETYAGLWLINYSSQGPHLQPNLGL